VLLELQRRRCRAAVIILPKSLIARILELDPTFEILYPVMQVIHKNCEGERCCEFDPETDSILHTGRLVTHVRFSRFEQIRDIEVVGAEI